MHDVGAVNFHCPVADAEMLGDFLAGKSLDIVQPGGTDVHPHDPAIACPAVPRAGNR